MKKFFNDFKAFIKKGNVIDLAVGVIIGSAFSAIVTALTNKIFMPFINWLLSLGGADDGLASAFTFLKRSYKTDELGNQVLDLANSIYIDWGAFITAILNFFIIALTLFLIVKFIMKSRGFVSGFSETIQKNTLNRAERKELKAANINIKDKNAVKEYFENKKLEEEKQKLLEEEKQKLIEEENKKNSQEYILKEIRDLLKEQKNKK